MTMTDARRRLPDRLLSAPGPFVSLCLDTEAATEQGDEVLTLRWKVLRTEAAENGASEETLEALDSVVHDSHRSGKGLVATASGNNVVLRRNLARPIADSISYGPLPRLFPLIEWDQENPSYAVVLADETGAEIHVVHKQELERSVEIESNVPEYDGPIPRRKGWPQSGFQRRAQTLREANAREVADALGRIAKEEELDLILVTGDVSARRRLVDHAPEHIRPAITEVDAHVRTIEEIADELESAVASVVAERTNGLLEKFVEERGQQDLAADGYARTMAALRMSQVQTLLLSNTDDDRRAFYIADDPNQCSTDRGELEALGMGDVIEASARDIVVRAALGTGANVCIIPTDSAEHGPKDGVGAILRFGV